MKAKTNFRVVVEPDKRFYSFINNPDEFFRDICEEMILQIKRHVDNVGLLHLEWDWICSFCGRDWEEDEDGPLCCTKAVEEYDNDKKT